MALVFVVSCVQCLKFDGGKQEMEGCVVVLFLIVAAFVVASVFAVVYGM